MSNSPEIFEKAMRETANKRRYAERVANENHRKFLNICPDADFIEKTLQSTGAQAARAVLMGENAKEQLLKLKDVNLKLQQEYQILLTKNGFSNSDIEPDYSCKICQDTGYVKGNLCECVKSVMKKLMYEDLNSQTPLEISSFTSIDFKYYEKFNREDCERMKKIFDYCRVYSRDFSMKSTSLLLIGSTGLGKTHLSLAIAKDAIDKGFGVVYGSVHSFALTIEKERFKDDAKTSETLTKCDLLILDDLGAEMSSAYTQAMIYDIINTRIMKNLPTIINTNLSPREIENRYGERTASRLLGAYQAIKFVGKDIRSLKRTT